MRRSRCHLLVSGAYFSTAAPVISGFTSSGVCERRGWVRASQPVRRGAQSPRSRRRGGWTKKPPSAPPPSSPHPRARASPRARARSRHRRVRLTRSRRQTAVRKLRALARFHGRPSSRSSVLPMRERAPFVTELESSDCSSIWVLERLIDPGTIDGQVIPACMSIAPQALFKFLLSPRGLHRRLDRPSGVPRVLSDACDAIEGARGSISRPPAPRAGKRCGATSSTLASETIPRFVVPNISRLVLIERRRRAAARSAFGDVRSRQDRPH